MEDAFKELSEYQGLREALRKISERNLGDFCQFYIIKRTSIKSKLSCKGCKLPKPSNLKDILNT